MQPSNSEKQSLEGIELTPLPVYRKWIKENRKWPVKNYNWMVLASLQPGNRIIDLPAIEYPSEWGYSKNLLPAKNKSVQSNLYPLFTTDYTRRRN